MKPDPATMQFRFDDADGNVLKRFSRQLPVEAWLMLHDDAEPIPNVLTVPIQFNSALLIGSNTHTLSAVLESVARAANALLDLALERRIEPIPDGDQEDGVGEARDRQT